VTTPAQPLAPDTGPLRPAALVALLGGALGSLALLVRAGQRQGTQRPLLLLMAVWVVAPFIGLGWAFVASKRWAKPNQHSLFLASLVIALASLAVYAIDSFQPAKAPPGFRFVLVPAISWLVIIVIVASASLSARKRV
jgi:hypothetical protein